MKRAITIVAALLNSALSTNALAGEQAFCSRASSQWADWVVSSRNKLGGNYRSIESLQLDIARGQNFHGAVNRMAARANMLLDTSLDKNEVKTDVYALCMSLT